MIKYSFNDKNNTLKLKVKGDVGTLASDVIVLMSKIYNDIKAKSPDSAKEFKDNIITAIEDGLVFVSKEERNDIIMKKCKEVKVQLTKKS